MSLLPSNVFVVILAGGSGTRFWPRSRQDLPKQLCKISDPHKTMLELTLDRVDAMVPQERRLLITHTKQVAATRRILGKRCPHVIAEPMARNTAAALAIAALEIDALHPGGDAIMISLHADHLIQDEGTFLRALGLAVKAAKKAGTLVLIGATPQYPETGYGYIKRGAVMENADGLTCYHVAHFKEKPSLHVAKDYVASADFYWNTGMFVWSTQTLLGAFQQYLPVIPQILRDAQAHAPDRQFARLGPEALAPYYEKLPNIPVDEAILEKSDRAVVIGAQFGWQDVGSWSALDEALPHDGHGNVVQGEIYSADTKNCIIQTDGPFVATIGLEGLCIVATKDAVLVCRKEDAQAVKNIVADLKERKRLDLT